jgi:hypothetical protein
VLVVSVDAGLSFSSLSLSLSLSLSSQSSHSLSSSTSSSSHCSQPTTSEALAKAHVLRECASKKSSLAAASTQFNCFTSTKVLALLVQTYLR